MVVNIYMNAVMGEDGKTVVTVDDSNFIPQADFKTIAKVYNGSAYVDCRVMFDHYGRLQITDMFSNAIPNIQLNYLSEGSFIVAQRFNN